MNYKELLKPNQAIKKIGKRINVHLQFRQDAKDFANYYIESAVNQGDFRYSIMLLVHSLEKGMCFSNPRPFGFDKVSELMSLLCRCSDAQKQEFEYQLGVSVLFAWVDFFENHGWQNETLYKQVREFLSDKVRNPKIIAGYKEYTPKVADPAAYEEMFLSRHSVRDYQFQVDIPL